MYKAVVFDLDGTLLDTLDDLTSAVNHALTAFAYPERTREEVKGFIGNGVRLLMQRAVGVEDERFEEIFSAFKSYYAVHCADATKPYTGIEELLSALKKRGVKTAVLSNKSDAAVKTLAKAYFPNAFSAAVGENEAIGIRKKPAPDALYKVMEGLGVNAAETVYIGDSEVDIQTAANAGVACVSVTWGFKDEAFLRENGGKLFARTPMEIMQVLYGE